MIAEQNQMEELKAKWEQLKSDNPKLRIKDCADMLGVSELALLLTDLNGENPSVRLLEATPPEVMARAKDLGYVMALTRNDSCVHERKGIYGDLSVEGQMGLFVGDDIDLRVFFSQWKYSTAVQETTPEGDTKRSLQFFDKYGKAVHKIHLNDKSNIAGFDSIVRDFAGKGNSFDPIERKETSDTKPQSEAVSVGGEFLQEWAELKDTHDFFGMLRRHKVTRIQSMRIAEGKFTKKLEILDVRRMLELASEKDAPIMVFVYNPGMVQIHTGSVKTIKPLGPWINVMDPEFNLHLREDHIANVWWVDKPTVDGHVQSIEVYDSGDNLIVQFFGKRKPGLPEREDWKEIMEELTSSN